MLKRLHFQCYAPSIRRSTGVMAPCNLYQTSQGKRSHLGLCSVGSHTATWDLEVWVKKMPNPLQDHTHGGDGARSKGLCT